MSTSQPPSSPQQSSNPLAQATSAARKGLRDVTKGGLLGFHWALPWLASTPSSLESASVWVWASQALSGLVAFILFLAAFGLLVMLTIQIVLELFLMSRIQAFCLPQYPKLRKGAPGNFRRELIDMAKLWAALCAGLLLWIIPLVGALSFFVLAAYINVRLLVNDVLSDIATAEEREWFVSQHRMGLLLLGLMMAGFLLIPFAGLLAPTVLGASVSHFCFTAIARLREETAELPLPQDT